MAVPEPISLPHHHARELVRRGVMAQVKFDNLEGHQCPQSNCPVIETRVKSDQSTLYVDCYTDKNTTMVDGNLCVPFNPHHEKNIDQLLMQSMGKESGNGSGSRGPSARLVFIRWD
jgi:hypothetical protein